MVRRRSTVRFRKGAPGCEEFSNTYPVTNVLFGAPRGAHLDGDHGLSGGKRGVAGEVSVSGFRNLT